MMEVDMTDAGNAEEQKMAIEDIGFEEMQVDGTHISETQVDETGVAGTDQDKTEDLMTAVEEVVSNKLQLGTMQAELTETDEEVCREECDETKLEKKQAEEAMPNMSQLEHVQSDLTEANQMSAYGATIQVEKMQEEDPRAGQTGSVKREANKTQMDGVETNKVETDRGRDHVYTSFSQPTEIRVVILMPSLDPDAPLTFSFHQSYLEDLEGRYEAISYVWGEPILEYPVYNISDGTQLLVARNLSCALRQLRHAANVRWLWADALCIDQKNHQEKAKQIPLMVDIFRTAKRVLAWLHQDDQIIRRGLQHIERLSRRRPGPSEDADIEGYHNDLLTNSRSPGQLLWEEINTSKSAVSDILTVLNLPYFRRLWIVQEIVFSPDISLICGSFDLSWFRFTTAITKLHGIAIEDSRFQDSHFDEIRATVAMWIDNCWHRSAVVPAGMTRDRIYAVQAFATKSKARIDIDYTVDKVQTYLRFALGCIKDGHMLGILDAALERLDVNTLSLNGPTWVPDWTRKPKRRRISRSVEDRAIFTYSRILQEPEAIKLSIGWKIRLNKLGIIRRLEVPSMLELHAAPITITDDTLSTVLPTVVQMYQDSNTSSLRSVRTLLDYLIKMSIVRTTVNKRNPGGKRRCSLFRSLDMLWTSTSTLPGETVAETTPAICATTAEGCSFFVAKSANKDDSYFCHTSPGVQRGDKIVLIQRIQNCSVKGNPDETYHAIAVRYVKTFSTYQSCPWSDQPLDAYRLVGEAWLLYPKAESIYLDETQYDVVDTILCLV
ncbi:hypothetical protein HBI56_198820 [Parastagonospora nodorum]|nr:hypothetical protein HBI13_206050 [Parastagonospora nodorum]KAH4217545.1 hypothetical protein HBI06_213930 [Parastagonospora nodorum]KAH4928265.1 hypothetical protein HBH73_198580 [Parastagonospora nodorum]KAH5072527.1 hypothetical protein HBI73_187830 [Parastagonospora nodorum]KAH5170833.1 hypothetical protein HBH77_227460 [Parastagonospora nodorum]